MFLKIAIQELNIPMQGFYILQYCNNFTVSVNIMPITLKIRKSLLEKQILLRDLQRHKQINKCSTSSLYVE